jgi:hypothetical protein
MAVIILVGLGLLFGCAQTASKAVLKNVELSAAEFKDWYGQFKVRINKAPDEDLGPFVIYITGIIGDDKARMPREGERLLDSINAKFKGKPDGYSTRRMNGLRTPLRLGPVSYYPQRRNGAEGSGVLKRFVAMPL